MRPAAFLPLAVWLALQAGPVHAEDPMPTPKAVIYPGDVISDDMLVDEVPPNPAVGGPFASSRAEVVGKAARLTLLPGRPIPLQGVNNPRVVSNGGAVSLVYIDGGLTIVASGSALQDGALGQWVKVRNVDSGVTVVGKVMPDGSVRVGGG